MWVDYEWNNRMGYDHSLGRSAMLRRSAYLRLHQSWTDYFTSFEMKCTYDIPVVANSWSFEMDLDAPHRHLLNIVSEEIEDLQWFAAELWHYRVTGEWLDIKRSMRRRINIALANMGQEARILNGQIGKKRG
jgi:hypothetical protein